MESLKEKTAKGLFWGGLSNGAQQLLNLVFGIFLARLLTTEDYGMVGMLTIFSLVAAFTTGVRVTLPMAIFLSIVATFSACGTSGVAGGSLMLVPLGCSLFGISNDIAMQLVGVGFIISVIQDSLETALNSSGDVLFTATAEFREWKKQGKKLPL